MKLTAVVQGDLAKLMKAKLGAAEAAVTTSIRTATDGLKTDLRGQIIGASLGTRLANTWRGRVYPAAGRSLGAAGYVWSRAPNIVRAYAEGATIRSKQGVLLAIPTVAAIGGFRGQGHMTPARWEAMHGRKLRFVSRGRVALLIADAANAGRKIVPLFVLVPQVTVKKRFDLDGTARRWAASIPALVSRSLRDE